MASTEPAPDASRSPSEPSAPSPSAPSTTAPAPPAPPAPAPPAEQSLGSASLSRPSSAPQPVSSSGVLPAGPPSAGSLPDLTNKTASPVSASAPTPTPAQAPQQAEADRPRTAPERQPDQTDMLLQSAQAAQPQQDSSPELTRPPQPVQPRVPEPTQTTQPAEPAQTAQATQPAPAVRSPTLPSTAAVQQLPHAPDAHPPPVPASASAVVSQRPPPPAVQHVPSPRTVGTGLPPQSRPSPPTHMPAQTPPSQARPPPPSHQHYSPHQVPAQTPGQPASQASFPQPPPPPAQQQQQQLQYPQARYSHQQQQYSTHHNQTVPPQPMAAAPQPAVAQPPAVPSQHQYHRNSLQDVTSSRPPDPRIARTFIVDSPAVRQASMDKGVSEHPAYASPTRDHFRETPKAKDDFFRLTYAINQSLPESVRRSVRDNWEKCLLGSDFHQTFVLNAIIHQVSPDAVKQSIRDFGSKWIDLAKEEIINQLTAADLDDLAHPILAKAGDFFLDLAFELRLRTIEAKPLINALARAERLGYEQSDIVEETSACGNGQEYASQQQQLPPPPPPPQVTGVARQTNNRPVGQCSICNRVFHEIGPFRYHMEEGICKRLPDNPREGFQYECAHCGMGFGNLDLQKNHNLYNVCGSSSIAPAPPAPVHTTPVAPPIPAPRPVGRPPRTPAPSNTVRNSSPLPSQRGYTSSQPPPPLSSPGSAVKHSKTNGTDPYAHLSSEQMAALNDELAKAELSYGERMRQVEALPDPSERRVKLDGLKNSFGTRQSMIRKRYGVRLRERRTKAEIEAERERMRTGARLPTGSPAPSNGHAGKYQQSPPSSQTNGTTANGWTAANQVATPANQTSKDENTAKRARTAYDNYGHPRPHVEEDEHRRRKTPTGSTAHGYSASETASAALALGSNRRSRSPLVHITGDLSDSSSDGEDIPARLPEAVRQSLNASR